MNILENLTKRISDVRPAKRIGRGLGSGKGFHTVGRGTKGQKARTGGKPAIWFEGGQTPLVRRMPFQRGFKNHGKVETLSFNIKDLENVMKKNKKITPEVILNSGLVKSISGIKFKLLSKGSLPDGITFENFSFSKKAVKKVEESKNKKSTK